MGVIGMKPESKIRIRQLIRNNILDNSVISKEQLAAEIARRWSRL